MRENAKLWKIWNLYKMPKNAYFYPAVRRLNNNFGGIPTKRTSSRYVEE